MAATATPQEQEIIEHGTHAIEIVEPDDKRAMVLMDRMDLQQAMSELKGSVIQTFVYVLRGKQQLSYAGIKEAARLYRNVDFGATATPLQDGSWIITSYAHNLADNMRVSLPMPYPKFNPGLPEQSIEYRANLSKSVRNALAAVLPVAYLNEMIARWLEQQGGGSQRQAQQPARGAASPSQLPQSLRDPEMAALREELDQWFKQFPDAKQKTDAALQAAKATHLSDNAVRKAVTALRQRAADEEAQRQEAAQEAAVTDMSAAEALAGALEVTRKAVEALSKKKGGPTAGDYEGMRVVLRELQRCDPLPDDTAPDQVPPKLLLDALRSRLAVADAGGGEEGARAVKQEIDDAIPF